MTLRMWRRGDVMQKIVRLRVRIVVIVTANLFKRTAIATEARMRMMLRLPRI